MSAKKIIILIIVMFAAVLSAGAGYASYTVSQDAEGPVEPDTAVWGEPAEYIAKTIWGEARGLSKTEQAAIVWCVLNRVDDARFPETVVEVVTIPGAFYGYSRWNPVDPDLVDLALDVIGRWLAEKDGYYAMSGRVLPAEYVYFTGRGGVNYFGTDYVPLVGMAGFCWNWSLESPYEVIK